MNFNVNAMKNVTHAYTMFAQRPSEKQQKKIVDAQLSDLNLLVSASACGTNS